MILCADCIQKVQFRRDCVGIRYYNPAFVPLHWPMACFL
jgi:hypothetical protein